MKAYIAIILIKLTMLQSLNAQSIPAELMSDGHFLWYQHSVTRSFTAPSRFGFSHVSSLYAYAASSRATELMSQAYLSYELKPGIRVAAGTFFATGPGFSPSLALQFSKQYKDLLMIIIPRTDIKRKNSFDVMAMLQYRPKLTNKVKFYSRLQMMSNYNSSQHNRSYQYLRAGIDIKNLQFGLALNLDHYGKHYDRYFQSGLFLRTEF